MLIFSGGGGGEVFFSFRISVLHKAERDTADHKPEIERIMGEGNTCIIIPGSICVYIDREGFFIYSAPDGWGALLNVSGNRLSTKEIQIWYLKKEIVVSPLPAKHTRYTLFPTSFVTKLRRTSNQGCQDFFEKWVGGATNCHSPYCRL